MSPNYRANVNDSYYIGISEAWDYSWDDFIQALFGSSVHHKGQQGR
jgi:hypothetical protein